MRSIHVRFAGVAAIAAAAVLVVSPGAVSAVETDMTISTTAVDFGSVNVGGTASATVTLTNAGGSPFGPINMFGGAPPTAEFGASQNCQGKTLPAGGSCSVTYTFRPSGAGTFTDSSNFTLSQTTSQSDGENFSVALAGSGRQIITPPVGPIATAVFDPGDEGGSSPSPTTTTVETSTTMVVTTTTTATTTSPATTPATAAPSDTSAVTTPPLTMVLVPGPLSDGGTGFVIAQGVVDLAGGAVGWQHRMLDLGAGPVSFGQAAPGFLVAPADPPVLVRIEGASVALLDAREAVFLPSGVGGDISAAVPGVPASALQIALVPSIEPFSFTPEAGRRDVNLVAARLEPGDSLHVVSPFPVLVAVLEGAVLDAPENTEVVAGTARSFSDADLTNGGSVAATVLIAAVGSAVP